MTSLFGRRNSWRDVRWLFVGVWLIFLVYPITAAFDSSDSAVGVALRIALIAVFAGTYLVAASRLLIGELGIATQGLGWVLILGALLAVAVPALGPPAAGLVPFFLVIAAVGLPLPWSIGVILVVVAISVAILPFSDGDPSITVITAAVGSTMLGVRVLRTRALDAGRAADRQRQLDEQLAIVAERERVARDVHDVLGHSLTVISVKTELAGKLIDIDPQRAKAELAEVNTLSRTALAEIRTTIGNLRTPELSDTLAAAESALTAAGIDVDIANPRVVDPAYAPLFAWVIREAVTNVVRHSDATRCTITLIEDQVSIADDGRGIGSAEPGNGLDGLTDRVTTGGGTLSVSSEPTTGTRITARMGATP